MCTLEPAQGASFVGQQAQVRPGGTQTFDKSEENDRRFTGQVLLRRYSFQA
jgi:hypothetical protein